MTGLKETDGKYYQGCGVVILPSKHESTLKGDELWINIVGELKLSKPNSICPGPQEFQHLYVTSNEGIKGGNWCYHPDVSQEYTIIKNGVQSKCFHPAQGVFQWKDTTNEWYKKAKKIIVSTDTSLRLPQPSQDFLKVYVEEYNKGNIIDKVLVEYTYELSNDEDEYGNLIPDLYLKINSSNEIHIKKLKDSWNREEINWFKENVELIAQYCKNTTTGNVSHKMPAIIAKLLWLSKEMV